MREKKILEAEHISVSFRMYDRGLSQYDLHIISDLSVEVHEGEIMVIVGASGSGKSVLAHAILGILPGNAIVGGTIRYDGAILDNALRKKLVGSEIIMIPQNYVELSDDDDIKCLNRILDLLDEDDDVQAVYHNWDE